MTEVLWKRHQEQRESGDAEVVAKRQDSAEGALQLITPEAGNYSE